MTDIDQMADLKSRVEMLEASVKILSVLVQAIPAPKPTAYFIDGDTRGPVDIAEELQSASSPDLPDPEWIPLIHVRTSYIPEGSNLAPTPCQKPAIYLTRRVSREETITASLFRMRRATEPEWREPVPTEPSLCVSCGEPVDIFRGDVDWEPAWTTSAPVSTEAQAPRRRTRNPRGNNAARRARRSPDIRTPSEGSPGLVDGPGPGSFSPDTPLPITEAATQEILGTLHGFAQELGLPDPRTLFPEDTRG
jgi:hypothetical protein